MSMRASRFPGGSKDNQPVPVTTTWDNLPSVFAPGDPSAGLPVGKHMIVPLSGKLDTPAWSPCEFRANGTRTKTDALRVHCFVVDFDGGTSEEIGALCTKHGVKKRKELPPAGLLELRKISEDNYAKLSLALKGLAFYAHTSFSHGTDEKPIALRIIVRLTRPIEAAEWPRAWRLLNAKFFGLCDVATKDVSRLYFVASMPSGTSDQAGHIVATGAGDALDVDRILGQDTNASAVDSFNAEMMSSLGVSASEEGRPVPLDEVNEFAHAVARSKSPKKSEVGKRLKKMCAGERFAMQGAADSLGGIDNALVRMCYSLCEQFPDAAPRSLAEHFKRALEIQFREDGEGHTVDDVHNKLVRFMAETRTRLSERDAQVVAARAVRIREAFGSERIEGYSPEELSAFGNAFGDMSHRWVIQYGSNYYVFFDGDYRPAVSEKSLVTAVARDLSPAYTAGVEVYKKRETGETVPKTPQELVLEYGSVAHEVHVELSAERCRYDLDRRVFVEAPCPLRVTAGEFVPEVDQWLKAINSPLLLAWIALVTRIDRPCSALYLAGAKATGKSLLAEGLARLWTTGGSTQALHALGGTWNEDLTRCPLVFADEALPPKLRASGYTGELREAIQNIRRPLVRKYRPNAIMLGAIRLVLAANNSSLLETTEALTPNDIAAIADRFLYVDMPVKAAEYLESIGGRKRVHEIFVERDGLAKHALWLRDNHPPIDGGRFFFPNGSEEIARSLTTSSGIRGSICAWLCMYLLDPGTVENMQENNPAGRLVFVDKETLHITPAALAQYWASYKTNRQPPSPGQSGTALRGLSTAEGVVSVSHGGKESTFYRIDPANLETWATETGYCSVEQLRRALAVASKTKGTKPANMPGANA